TTDPELLAGGDAGLREATFDCDNPVARIGVREKPGGDGALLVRFTEPLERLEDQGHLTDVVSVIECVVEPEIVGLPLRVAAVAEEEELKPGARNAPELLELREEDAAQSESDLRELRA